MHPPRGLLPRPRRFIFTYGMLIYKLLGEGAESSFASSFGVSYGLGAAQEARASCIAPPLCAWNDGRATCKLT
jgi:hypothetical protein